MKRILLCVLAIGVTLNCSAQSKDKPWSLGIDAGGEQYNGVLGNGFYTNHGLYGFGGLSAARYLSPHFDLSLALTAGDMGYRTNGADVFRNSMFQGHLDVRFSFFRYEKVMVRPFLFLGFGDVGFRGNNINSGEQADKMSLPDLGGGLNIKVTPTINVKLQETFIYPIHSGTDAQTKDRYLQHSIGIAFNIGRKKDADHDGVADDKDKCPDTPEGIAVDANGCPLDKDGDGIPDYLDKCPDVKGPAATHGCPDSDNDGVADNDDKCPNTPAGVAVDASGCPLDKDGDGIPDYQDACPDAKGPAATHGCPDSDKDGVSDDKDKCPNTPAGVAVDVNGCPIDRDGDGVPDYLDKCPDVKGLAANNGCPAVKDEDKAVMQRALEGIEFETGKDVIRKNSYKILDEVVVVMKDNPSYHLDINGYTDNTGNAAKNLALSEKRADAVKKYLEDHGVDGSRTKASGFGGGNPRGDNKTEAGRKLNRRVEFKLDY